MNLEKAEKEVRATDKGMRVLYPRIMQLRTESYKLELAYNRLWEKKKKAQVRLTPIQVVKPGASGRKSSEATEIERLQKVINALEAQIKERS